MTRRRWPPLELIGEGPGPGPVRATFLDKGWYGATCLCGQLIVFDHRAESQECPGCMHKFKVRPAKVE